MKILAYGIIVCCLSLTLPACTQKRIANPDGSYSRIQDTMRTYLASDSVIDWSASTLRPDEVLFQDVDTLVIPEEIEDSKAEIHIRAFHNTFHRLIPPTWVLGYVSAHTERGKEQLPGPTIEATNGSPTQIKWVNQLAETLQHDDSYNFPYQDMKYYPLVYNTKTLAETMGDPSKPMPSASIPMLVDALYPARIDDTVAHEHGPFMFHSTYYSTTVHLHGANLAWKNDGYTASSITEKAGDTPQPTPYGLFGPYEKNKTSVTSQYTNTFEEANFDTTDTSVGRHGAILWYHDHSVMRTTPNVYMGLFGAYIIEGLGESASKRDHFRADWRKPVSRKDVDPIPDIPLLISDKMFTQRGHLYYESKFDTSGGGRQPEFFGNTITVNGKAWPHFDVKKQAYRFRILNTSSSRFYRLALAHWKNGEVDLTPIDPKTFIQIGTEGGPMTHSDTASRYITKDNPLMLAPGERADVTINFSEFGTSSPESLVLLNLAAGHPYQENPQDDNIAIETIKASVKMYENFVMQFRVQPQASPNYMKNIDVVHQIDAWHNDPRYLKMANKLEIFDKRYRLRNPNLFFRSFQKSSARRVDPISTLPDAITAVLKNTKIDDVYSLSIIEAGTFLELPSAVQSFYNDYPAMEKDTAFPMAFLNGSEWNMEANVFKDTLPKSPEALQALSIKKVTDRKTEVWKITNYTGDTHPIHIHLNRFRVLGRINKDNVFSRDPRESGWKDVVRVKPDTTTTYLVITYTLSKDEQTNLAQFVYHCHILEHEDVSMMRRLLVEKRGKPGLAQANRQRNRSALYDKLNIPLCNGPANLVSNQTPKRAASLYRTIKY